MKEQPNPERNLPLAFAAGREHAMILSLFACGVSIPLL
jgi:hypothetical protein